MEKEQTEIIPTLSDKENKDSYGKFQTADELLKAYNSLESEFTKRSQRLKELENVKKATDWEGKVSELVKKYPVAETLGVDIAKEISEDSELTKSEDCLEKALLKVLSKNYKAPDDLAKEKSVIDKVLESEENREKIIDEYLAKIKSKQPPITLPKGGAIPLSPPQKLASIKEAGEMARKIIEES